MKRIITAAGAAATALLVMAALSAASASATTVVCSSPETPCESNNIEPAGSYVVTGDTAGFPSIIFEASGIAEFECSGNTMSAESKAGIGSTLPAKFDGTLAGCIRTNGKTACTGSMNSPPTTLEASTTGGYMKIGTATEPLAFTFNCGTGSGSFSCTYQAKDTVNLNVQEEGAKALAVPMARGAGSNEICSPSSPRLWVKNTSYGDFISTFTETGTVLCKVAEEPCSEENRYGPGTTVEATPSGKFILNNPIAKAECTSSPLVGKLTGGNGIELTSLSFTGCANSISVTVENLPYKLGVIYHGTGPGEGDLYLKNVKIKYFRFGISCYYGGTVTVKIGQGGELSFQPLTLLSGSSAVCGKVGSPTSVTANYSITTPNPFYVSWY